MVCKKKKSNLFLWKVKKRKKDFIKKNQICFVLILENKIWFVDIKSVFVNKKINLKKKDFARKNQIGSCKRKNYWF